VPYDIRLDSNSMETVQNSQISYEFTDDSDDDYMVLSGYASTEDVISDVDNLQILTKITESSPNISVPKSPHISDDKIHIVHDDNNIDDNDNSDRPKKHKKKKNFNIRRGYLFFRIPETPRRKLRILSRMPRNKKIRRTFSATQSEGSDKISVNIPIFCNSLHHEHFSETVFGFLKFELFLFGFWTGETLKIPPKWVLLTLST
jgi:hypothetical protein